MKMFNPKILITGGAGYIGSHTNKLFSKKGYETVVYDSLIYGHREFLKWGEFILGDLADKTQLDLVFKKYKISAVIHFAAFAYVGESVQNPCKYYLNNVKNTLNLLETMLENNVKNIVFSSSCATYGNPIEIPIRETHPQNPVNPYGRTKLMIENILADYASAYGLNYAALRYFNAAGADPCCEIGEWHEPETHLIPLILDVAYNNSGSVKIYGTDYNTSDGTCVRDYIHVTDLAQAHYLALEYIISSNKSACFNLGNMNGFSVKEVIKEVEKVTGKIIKAEDYSRRTGDPAILIGNSEMINKVLGWKPEYNTLSSIIETAWRWHLFLNDIFLKSRKI